MKLQLILLLIQIINLYIVIRMDLGSNTIIIVSLLSIVNLTTTILTLLQSIKI
jgi:hypothetical protein